MSGQVDRPGLAVVPDTILTEAARGRIVAWLQAQSESVVLLESDPCFPAALAAADVQDLLNDREQLLETVRRGQRPPRARKISITDLVRRAVDLVVERYRETNWMGWPERDRLVVEVLTPAIHETIREEEYGFGYNDGYDDGYDDGYAVGKSGERKDPRTAKAVRREKETA